LNPLADFEHIWQKHNYIPTDFVKINGLIAKRDPIAVSNGESYNVGSCLIRVQIFHKGENPKKCLVCMKSFR